ncbi:MAG TPA: bifunctional proline dehydrogenase/L-glutamate gamma-semialdehyde dehydrogenase PutA [Chromatiales bacterium]|nr:bifunctional proline dehydrogenase/L-glutamate gamma-semialdehyde dehydrogenase PutA [Thiotrichales bacterium]HIP68387.1 bifunctional proline dehydrogenase/L-glutamate gamma-semialdehyde dehydrogenase PutA [Chromatiales bacterium]
MTLKTERAFNAEPSVPLLADRPVLHDPLRTEINRNYRADEADVVKSLLEKIHLTKKSQTKIQHSATELVKEIRRRRTMSGSLDAFMHEYDLSSEEGVMLMCLSEAFLRIPDLATADKLIADKIGGADWEKHLGESHSVFVNASTWALVLTGQVIHLQDYADKPLNTILKKLSANLGDPLIRQSVAQGMRIIARQFVLGRTIDEALRRAQTRIQQGYSYSFDMLGEAAHTSADAETYFQAYRNAITKIGAATHADDIKSRPGISIKLSALHPRYEFSQHGRVMRELLPRIIELARMAKQAAISLTLDAEEADRLDLSFDILEAIMADDTLNGWNGLGLALQAYQKRAFPAIEWLEQLTKKNHRHLMVRLVKGAYWDTEIKHAQQAGLDGYPVFTRKINTDVSYLACAQRLLAADGLIYPQFASHNAHTVAAVMEMAGDQRDYEFQRLHGMGATLYEQLVGKNKSPRCRIYAPVGSHGDLLPYLVRRLLENGANTSFINRIVDDKLPIEKIVEDPVEAIGKLKTISHPKIPLPGELFKPQRENSKGLDLSDRQTLRALQQDLEASFKQPYQATPIIAGENITGKSASIYDPANSNRIVGSIVNTCREEIIKAVNVAAESATGWDKIAAEKRARYLERIAELYQRHTPELMALVIRETGKTIADAVAEVREAVDFCRYYAFRCRAEFASPMNLPGATGESNTLHLHGRGVFACISPWNFPLAIFTGQITAALAAGNSVVAKPAEQSSLVAHFATTLMHQAGIPNQVLHLLPGDGPGVGSALISQPQIAGVAFTGGFDAARMISQKLANRTGPVIPLIAETGGLNAMIVDSSALTEQVVTDVLGSAFQSAGQRCSSLRVLYLQDDIADQTIEMLIGAMQELRIGDPGLLGTDIGPVIDKDALTILEKHFTEFKQSARLVFQCTLPKNCNNGLFFAPCVFEISGIEQLQGETFGPILHIVRYAANELNAVINRINQSGYGLTLGIHSRINSTIESLTKKLKVGNIYVNRNQIGAVVGVQPFGGEGLSGTGPKAGGLHYLQRFATERVTTINTTAQGGNVSLLTLT